MDGEDLGNVIKSFVKTFDEETVNRSQEELESYWFFKWNETKTVEQNIYEFYKMLGLYESQCRKWEEHHNGSCCVVERVRDRYLMPKIKEFHNDLEQWDY